MGNSSPRGFFKSVWLGIKLNSNSYCGHTLVVSYCLPPAVFFMILHYKPHVNMKQVTNRFSGWSFIYFGICLYLKKCTKPSIYTFIICVPSLGIKSRDLGIGDLVFQSMQDLNAGSHHHDTPSHHPDNQTLDQPLSEWLRLYVKTNSVSWICWDSKAEREREWQTGGECR